MCRQLPIVHERRRFMDIMDEEIDDERRSRISRYDAEARQHVPRRLRYEMGTRADAVVEAETLLESKRQGQVSGGGEGGERRLFGGEYRSVISKKGNAGFHAN